MPQNSTRTTRHTCGGPVFGKKTPGCPRCDELTAGAQPVRWRESRKQEDARRSAEIRAHFASDRHRTQCKPVCTFGEW